MSTQIANFRPDAYGRLVAEGVTENAIFSAFHNLVSQRRAEGLTKAQVADRMEVGRAVVTKLTSAPSNMKISTIASMANALDADIVFLLADRKARVIYSAVGVHEQSLFQNKPIVQAAGRYFSSAGRVPSGVTLHQIQQTLPGA